jgi:serine protease Do
MAIVVTCAHGYNALNDVVVLTQDGRSFQSNVLGVDTLHDIMVVRIQDPGITPMMITKEVPEVGDKLFMAGFAGGQFSGFKGLAGVMEKVVSPSKNGESNFLAASFIATPGCSGGPILNARGEVVSIVTGSGENTVGPILALTFKYVKFVQ